MIPSPSLPTGIQLSQRPGKPALKQWSGIAIDDHIVQVHCITQLGKRGLSRQSGDHVVPIVVDHAIGRLGEVDQLGGGCHESGVRVHDAIYDVERLDGMIVVIGRDSECDTGAGQIICEGDDHDFGGALARFECSGGEHERKERKDGLHSGWRGIGFGRGVSVFFAVEMCKLT